MKKLLLTFTVLSLLFLVGCKSDPAAKLLGTWEIESAEGTELTDEIRKQSVTTFEKDGKIKVGESSGTYEVSKDGKSVTMTIDGKTDSMNDFEVKKEEFSYKQDGKKIVFRKKK